MACSGFGFVKLIRTKLSSASAELILIFLNPDRIHIRITSIFDITKFNYQND